MSALPVGDDFEVADEEEEGAEEGGVLSFERVTERVAPAETVWGFGCCLGTLSIICAHVRGPPDDAEDSLAAAVASVAAAGGDAAVGGDVGLAVERAPDVSACEGVR